MSRATSPAFAIGGAEPYVDIEGLKAKLENKLKHHAPTEYVDVVCDGFPNPDGPRFIELENESGHSISYGEWIKRNDGHCVLRIPLIKKD